MNRQPWFPFTFRIPLNLRFAAPVLGVLAFALCVRSSAAPGDHIRPLNDPGTGRWGLFGASIAVSGQKILVGLSTGFNIGGNGAYLFDAQSGDLLLEIGVPEVAAEFGAAAMIGNKVILGNVLDYPGYVYVYDGTQRGETSSPVLYIEPPDQNFSGAFGPTITPLGVRLMVDLGWVAVQLYDISGSGTINTPILSLHNSPSDYAFGFGQSFCGVGMYILVGAPYASDGPDRSHGKVLGFDGTARGDIFSPSFSILRPPANYAGILFGWSVSPCGENALIGAPNESDEIPGEIFLYRGSVTGETSYNPLLTILPPPEALTDSYRGSGFGYKIAAAGGNVLVGAPEISKAFVFSGLARGVTDEPLLTLSDPDPGVPGRFGSTVAAMGTNLIVSKLLYTGGSPSGGGVYIFEGFPEISPINGAAVTGYQIAGAAAKRGGDTAVISGSPAQVLITVKNMGNTSWTSQEGYGLAIRPSGGPIRPHRLALPEGTVIPPGGTFQFSETIPALRKPYQFRLQARMFQDSKGPFGKPLTIKVKVRKTAP